MRVFQTAKNDQFDLYVKAIDAMQRLGETPHMSLDLAIGSMVDAVLILWMPSNGLAGSFVLIQIAIHSKCIFKQLG